MAYQNITPVKLGLKAIGTSVETVYTVPASTRTLLKDISICNTTAATVTVDVYLVPSAGSAGTGNALMYTLSISANSIIQWNGVQILNVGDTIQTKASAVGCTAHFSGGEAI